MKGSEFLTLGGLMNLFSAASYGGIAWLIIRLCQRAKTQSEITVDATVTSPTVVTADEGVTVAGLDTEMVIAIRQKEDVYLRTITNIELQAITIDRAIPITGAVSIAIYEETGAVRGDSNKYVPGTAEDKNRPAVIRVPSLSLDVDDRVTIRNATGQTRDTKVTAKNADGTVEVEDPVFIRDASEELLVAKLRPGDPFALTCHKIVNAMNVGCLQYLHDPYGQILYRKRPTSTVGKIFARSARYLFGTKMWGLPGITGYFWYDNAFRSEANEALSAMEQEASFRSGDTYCPVASLHGTIDVVGDVARYWVTADGGDRDGVADMIFTARQDAPGVHLRQQHLRTISTATQPGYSIPDLFAAKDNNGRDWEGIASQGWIPIDADLERTSGSYVTFSRPPDVGGTHVIAARSLAGLGKSETAQKAGPSGVPASPFVPVPPTKRAVKVSFERDVKDVTVKLATAPVDEGTVIRLIPFQSAAATVDPGGDREYRITVSQPGRVARVSGDTLTLDAANVAVGAQDFVEISRFYPVDSTSPDLVVGIGPMHLATPVHVGVRRFVIETTDQLVVIGGAPLVAGPVAEAHAGDPLVLLVPAPPFQTPAPALVSAVAITPTVAADAAVSDTARDLLGPLGVAYVITIADREPPEDDVVITFNWRVGTTVPNSAPVTARLTLRPHFQLTPAGAIAVAPNGDVTLTSSDGTLMTFEDGGAGVTLAAVQPPTANQITLHVDATTTPGPRTILVKEQGSPTRFARRLITVT